eukprot:scaffold12049_cov141-Skeletonema_menzelii.AAC.6
MTNFNREEVQGHRQGVDYGDRPFCATEKAVRGDALLEDWPKTKSNSMTSPSFGPGEDDVASSIVNKKVCISEFSQLHAYESESKCLLRSLTYTKEDRDEFGRDALLEGLRIKNLIAAAPYDSDAQSIKYLLSHDIISKAELLGIEHFILGKARRVRKIRQCHSAAVLWKQQEQQHQELEDPALNLGEFAHLSSLRSTEGARIRAGLAVPRSLDR